MASSRNNRQPASEQVNVFYGSTLKDAYRQVEKKYGKEVIILGSRRIVRRQEKGLGQEHLVEVTVQPPGDGARRETQVFNVSEPTRAASPQRPAARSASAPIPDDVVREISREVARIETLVQGVIDDMSIEMDRSFVQGNPLAETLVAAGTDAAAVENLFTRFAGETGGGVTDRPAVLGWLNRNLKASNCAWDGFFGCHAFLGDSGSGRTTMVLAAATELKKLGKKTLVLSLHPAHAGEIRRLQNAAATVGFDAAIIRKDGQLASSESHLAKYEAVLLDMPDLDHESLAIGGPIHNWLARNPSFHRHLVVPLDRDLRDCDLLAEAARSWNCDWLALSRLDRTRMTGKILDLAERIPLPYSVCGEIQGAEHRLRIASSGDLLDRILAAGSRIDETGFVAGSFAGLEMAL